MKRFSAISCISILLWACNAPGTSNQQEANDSSAAAPINSIPSDEKDLHVTLLDQYFLSNKIHFEDSISCYVVTDKAKFENMFGVAKTMTNKITVPNFEKEYVFAIAVPATEVKTSFVIDSARISGNNADIYFSITRGGRQGYKSSQVILGTFDKSPSIQNIGFYYKGEMVKMIPLPG